MSTAKHTPEPWSHTKLCGQASGAHAENCIGIIGHGGVAVAWINLNPSQGDKVEDGLADAARAVACVNACAGMEDPAKAIADARQNLKALIEVCEVLGATTSIDGARRTLRALGVKP